MKLAYLTTYDARTLYGSNEWSGTGYYIAQALKNQGISLEYLGPLEEKLVLKFLQKYKRFYYKYFQNKHYECESDLLVLKDYARQISLKLSSLKPDVIFSATIKPIVYLDCSQPIVFWADATCASLVDFYPQYTNLCQESLENWHMIERLALQKCALAIYSSNWAAQSAINHYGANPSKVKVVPFGANINDCDRTLEQVKTVIEARPSNKCKLLFLGVDWFRKGGDIALNVAKKLNNSGLETELAIVGCQPIEESPLPDFVKVLGFINKSTDEGQKKINKLIADSHFLILPAMAECYGVVFCEANSFGVPCIGRNVGGIPTIINSNVNGKIFDFNADVQEYHDYILNLFDNYVDYVKLAISSFEEYKNRLNWLTAGKSVHEMLIDIF